MNLKTLLAAAVVALAPISASALTIVTNISAGINDIQNEPFFWNGDFFTFSPNLISHPATKHFYAYIVFLLGALDHLLLIPLARVTQSHVAAQALA